MSASGKIAIITGSTGGIGKSVALRLGAQGAKVVVNGRNREAGDRMVSEIEALGGEAFFVAGDVLVKQDMLELARATVERWGRIDILVASAGAAEPPKSGPLKSYGVFDTLDPEDVAEVIKRAALAKLNPAHAVAPHMISKKAGSIVFITSEGGRSPTVGQTSVAYYSGGLIMMAKVVAKELSRHRVRVNTVAITMVRDTPAWERFTGGNWDELKKRSFSRAQERAPFGLAEPDDIASVVAFLASDEAGFVTGATLSATGGLTFA